jgi:hypothetical protein
LVSHLRPASPNYFNFLDDILRPEKNVRNKYKMNTQASRKRTRKNTTAGGKRRKTRKLSKGASAWNKEVMAVFHRMRKADKNIKFRDALIQAAKERNPRK